jgi:hypothetical protein
MRGDLAGTEAGHHPPIERTFTVQLQKKRSTSGQLLAPRQNVAAVLRRLINSGHLRITLR